MTDPEAKNTSSAKIIDSEYHFSLKKKNHSSFLEKGPISGPGQKIIKMSLTLHTQESKDSVQKHWGHV